MPHVHDEDEAVTVGFLPNLVLKGVVEDEDFTFLPLPADKDAKEGFTRVSSAKQKEMRQGDEEIRERGETRR